MQKTALGPSRRYRFSSAAGKAFLSWCVSNSVATSKLNTVSLLICTCTFTLYPEPVYRFSCVVICGLQSKSARVKSSLYVHGCLAPPRAFMYAIPPAGQLSGPTGEAFFCGCWRFAVYKEGSPHAALVIDGHLCCSWHPIWQQWL